MRQQSGRRLHRQAEANLSAQVRRRDPGRQHAEVRLERASALARANPGQIDAIGTALRRLTDSSEMGPLFKVFCASAGDLEPIGFA